MVQSHLYTRQKETEVFPEMGEPTSLVCVLGQGTWLGEIERKDGWVHVVGIMGNGWVKEGDVENRSPFNLHIKWTPGKPIEYVSSAA